MASTYRAVVDGDHIRWIDSRRELVREALEQLAARGGIAGIEDPAVWQRETRSDRVLPGREP